MVRRFGGHNTPQQNIGDRQNLACGEIEQNRTANIPIVQAVVRVDSESSKDDLAQNAHLGMVCRIFTLDIARLPLQKQNILISLNYREGGAFYPWV